MHPLRLLTTTVVVALAFAASALAESRAKKGQIDGTFAGIEQGDYAHLLVRTKNKVESFFVLRPDKSVQAFLDNPNGLKGRKIRVHWEERNEHIPEAGGKQQIKVVTKVDERR